MRVLWFSVTPSLFIPKGVLHNAGGWISSLQKIVMRKKEIDLGVAFYYAADEFKYVKDDVTYYPISKKSNYFNIARKQYSLYLYINIIKDFKPDIIHIFGSENDFGTICGITDIPVIIHIQGSLPPYLNALFPIDVNQYDFFFTGGLSLKDRYIGLRSKPSFQKRAKREISIIKNCNYFMGRTDWDKNLIKLFHPSATYFHCEEALRESFMHLDKHWSFHDSQKKTIVSVISSPWYKGVDLILKTAKLLSTYTNNQFSWLIYGVNDIKFYEKKYKIKASNVNVKVKGIATSDDLIRILIEADCYVHPSYIENSPNSICEAQMIGIPVIATNVGGVSSILENGKAGILVPANDPFTLAIKLNTILYDQALADNYSSNAISLAESRHDYNQIYNALISIYSKIIS